MSVSLRFCDAEKGSATSAAPITSLAVCWREFPINSQFDSNAAPEYFRSTMALVEYDDLNLKLFKCRFVMVPEMDSAEEARFANSMLSIVIISASPFISMTFVFKLEVILIRSIPDCAGLRQKICEGRIEMGMSIIYIPSKRSSVVCVELDKRRFSEAERSEQGELSEPHESGKFEPLGDTKMVFSLIWAKN